MKVTEICFLSDRQVRLVVEIPATESYTTEGASHIPRILFKMFPNLATQRCDNALGQSFRREAQATEIPHLFEHLILAVQDQVRRGSGTPFAGETEWNWTLDPRGRFYVTVDYENEIVALGAIRLAERLINLLDSKDAVRLDMPREINRLREIARLSRRRHHRAATLSPHNEHETNTGPPSLSEEKAGGPYHLRPDAAGV